MATDDHAEMPSGVSSGLGGFDRFATLAGSFASKPWFFALCVVIVVVWGPSYFAFGTVDTWQLVINTTTTIITFLLVALLQNTQSRSESAMQQKLNAIADGLADLMANLAASQNSAELHNDVRELRLAVGLESHESA